MGPKSIRFRIPTLNRPSSPVIREYDIDAFVEKVPTIVVSHYRQEDEDRRKRKEDEETIIESLSGFFKRVATAENENEKDDDDKGGGLDLRVPDATDKVDDEFANFVQNCQAMMEEVRKIKNREPIKDFLDSIPPKEAKREDGSKKVKKRRRKRKKKAIDHVRMNKIKRFVYDRNVKYHRRCCLRTIDEIRSSLAAFPFHNRVPMGNCGGGDGSEFEVVLSCKESSSVNLSSIYEDYLRRERRRTARRCKLEIVARKLVTAADVEDGSPQELKVPPKTVESKRIVTKLSPGLIHKLILKGKSMRTRRNLQEEEVFDHEDTPESVSDEEQEKEKGKKEAEDVLEMSPETSSVTLRENRLSGHHGFSTLAVTTFGGSGDRLLLGHIRVPSAMPSRCLCHSQRREDKARLLHWGRPRLREAVADATKRKKEAEAAAVSSRELGRRPSGLDFIRGLMNNPFTSWSAYTASPTLSTVAAAAFTSTHDTKASGQKYFKARRSRKWNQMKPRPDSPERAPGGGGGDHDQLESNTQVGASSEVHGVSELNLPSTDDPLVKVEVSKGFRYREISPSMIQQLTGRSKTMDTEVVAAKDDKLSLQEKGNEKISDYLDEEEEDFWLHLPRTFSHKSSRFELPADFSALSQMTPLQYLETYVFVSSARKLLYQKVFNRHRSLKEGTLNIETVIKALEEVMGDRLTPPQQSQLWEDYLDVRPSFLLSFSCEQFCGLASFVERLLCDEFAGRHRLGNAAVKRTKSEIEVADFDRLSSKMEDAGMRQGAFRNLLIAIKGVDE